MKKFLVKVFFEKNFFSKGFIGPIGDDLPSLIPIMISLLLFFSVFALTLNTYYSKNAVLSQQMQLVSIARELKGDSLILGIDQFNSNCGQTKLKRYSYNFMAAIYPAEADFTGILDDFSSSADFDIGGLTSDNFLTGFDSVGNESQYFCGYKKIGGRNFDNVKATNYFVRFYPVAVTRRVIVYPVGGAPVEYFLTMPGVMAMVVWE